MPLYKNFHQDITRRFKTRVHWRRHFGDGMTERGGRRYVTRHCSIKKRKEVYPSRRTTGTLPGTASRPRRTAYNTREVDDLFHSDSDRVALSGVMTFANTGCERSGGTWRRFRCWLEEGSGNIGGINNLLVSHVSLPSLPPRRMGSGTPVTSCAQSRIVNTRDTEWIITDE